MATANTTEAIAQSGGATFTLGIPGVPITLNVGLTAVGNIDTVTVADVGFAQGPSTDHRVTFERSTDGTVVQVKAKGEELTAKVKTSNLADLLGTQTWTGRLFATDSADTTVSFDIGWGDASNTYLEITSISVSVLGDSSITPTINGIDSESDGDDNGYDYESHASITFVKDGFTRTLTVETETEYEDEADHAGPYAKLKIELRGSDSQVLTGEDAYKTQAWQGLLCDGTTALVTYTFVADGTVTVDVTFDGKGSGTGTPSYTLDTDDDGFDVHFTDTEGNSDASLEAGLESDHGTLELRVTSQTTSTCDDSGDDEDEDHSQMSDDGSGSDDHSKIGDDSNDSSDDKDHSKIGDDNEDDDASDSSSNNNVDDNDNDNDNDSEDNS